MERNVVDDSVGILERERIRPLHADYCERDDQFLVDKPIVVA
jgi:hypothetical protein